MLEACVLEIRYRHVQERNNEASILNLDTENNSGSHGACFRKRDKKI